MIIYLTSNITVKLNYLHKLLLKTKNKADPRYVQKLKRFEKSY